MGKGMMIKIGAGIAVLVVAGAGLFALNGDSDSPTAAGDPLGVNVRPGSGTSGNSASISIANAAPNVSVVLTYSDGSLEDRFTTGAKADNAIDHVFSGQPGDVVITAVVGNATTETVTGRYTITAAAGPIQPTVTLTPTSGKSPTEGRIDVVGDPLSPLTMTISPGNAQNVGTTDGNGKFTMPYTFSGLPGTVTVSAVTGAGANAPVGSADFLITSDAPPAPMVTVSVDPDEGEAGTPADIAVTGPPNQPVTLKIGGTDLQTNGSTDAQGNYNFPQHVFQGNTGPVSVEAQIGSGGVNDPKGSTVFTITAPISSGGPFVSIGNFMVMSDPGGHAGFIAMPSSTELDIRIGSISISGADPFVDVAGDLAEDGSFSVSGAGTVAGFPDVTVSFDGIFTPTSLEGQYTMGVNGELPGGEPIVFDVSGVVEDAGAAAEAEPDFAAFYEVFTAVQTSGDSSLLLDALNPAVIEVYGADQCGTYLAGIMNPEVSVTFAEQVQQGPWDYEVDDVSVPVADVYELVLDLVVGEAEVQRVPSHVTVDELGNIRWFTDCGDPIATG